MIPDTFTLANRKWKVLWVPDHQITCELRRDGWGMCRPDSAEIWLNEKLLTRQFKDLRYQTFMHEMMHAVLFTMGYAIGDPPHEEALVEGMSALLAQFEITKKGNPM